jgi:uncharacterized protein
MIAERLSIYLSQTEHHGHAADYVEIVSRARRAGMAGATVLQGTEGFGSSSTVHRQHAMAVSEERPVVVVVIDITARIDAFLSGVADVATQALIVRKRVEVLRGNIGSAAP